MQHLNKLKVMVLLMLVSSQLTSDKKDALERGVIDRIEEGYAVILIKDQKKQMTVLLEKLPEGSYEGVWLDIADTPEMMFFINEHMTEKYAEQNEQLRKRNKKNPYSLTEDRK